MADPYGMGEEEMYEGWFREQRQAAAARSALAQAKIPPVRSSLGLPTFHGIPIQVTDLVGENVYLVSGRIVLSREVGQDAGILPNPPGYSRYSVGELELRRLRRRRKR